ncbi:hypothetical protein IAT38_006222 [Cryptococcus sp. DSM 104549]
MTNTMSPQPPTASPKSDLEESASTVSPTADDTRQHLPRHEDHYIFKRLRREMPLPSKRLSYPMLGTLFTVMFLAGWNDASLGPLLPSLQDYYNVNYLVISSIWLTAFAGFMTSGICNVYITDRVGFGIAAPFGALMQGLGYVLMCWGSPYPLFLVAFSLNGFGMGLQVNTLASRLPNASTKMFLLHAWYGVGATVSPLVSTAFVKHVPRKVYSYFAVSLGLALATAAGLLLAFGLRTGDQVVGGREEQRVGVEELVLAQPVAETTPNLTQEKKASQDSGSKMRAIMKNPVVHFLAFYLFVYVGVEVAIGGWATSFLIDERGGDNSSGYVSVGYFAGLTLGRIVLIPLSNWLGHHRSITLYSAISIALLLVIWFTHTIIGNAICYAFIGLFFGPIYPIVMNVVIDLIPGELQGGTIGWIASLGQAGSASLPFITGVISEKHGVWILQPFLIAFLIVSILLWMPMVWAGHPDRPVWHIPQAATAASERLDREKKEKEAGGEAAEADVGAGQ